MKQKSRKLISSIILLTTVLSGCSKNISDDSPSSNLSSSKEDSEKIDEIEITSDNWNDYLEIREENIPGYDTYDDFAGFAHAYSLCFKKDLKVADPLTYKYEINVEYSYTQIIGNVSSNTSDLTYKILNEDETSSLTGEKYLSYYAYSNDSQYIVKDGYTKDYYANGRIGILNYDVFGKNDVTCGNSITTELNITRAKGTIYIIQ